MTATPHNGKEEDFQLFLALLDGDRFEGRFRDGVHVADVSDPMRRMVKERLLKFDGKPLFPEGGAVVGALARGHGRVVARGIRAAARPRPHRVPEPALVLPSPVPPPRGLQSRLQNSRGIGAGRSPQLSW